MPEVGLRVGAQDLARVADEGRDVDERVRGSINRRVEMRCSGYDCAGDDINLQLGSKIAVFLHVVVGSGGDFHELGVLRRPGCEVVFWEDCEGGAILCGLTDVFLCGCEVAVWV